LYVNPQKENSVQFLHGLQINGGRMNYGLGYVPSPPDSRDWLLVPRAWPWDKEFPERYMVPDIERVPVFDQGMRGSCVSQAAQCLKEWQELQEDKEWEDLSPEFVYTLCKQLDGIPDMEGTYPRVAMSVLKNYGICAERLCPYQRVDNNMRLTEEMHEDAKRNRIARFARVSSFDALKLALMEHGPVMIGVPVYSNWKNNGIIPMPDGQLEGGHAITVIGWEPDGWVFRNSWGMWGQKGNGILPLSYPDILSDAWLSVDITPTLRVVRHGQSK
jgi:C1A family cysteine protease